MPIEIDFGEWNAFVKQLSNADKNFKKNFLEFIEATGVDFLDAVKKRIEQKGNVDTGRLLKSFTKGDDDNIWVLDSGNYSLEIGSNVEYASYVNNGHWTCKKGDIGRWIPGKWEGDKFTYDPEAKTGMYLKQKWVDGSSYFTGAEEAMNKVIPKYCKKRLEAWLVTYFQKYL